VLGLWLVFNIIFKDTEKTVRCTSMPGLGVYTYMCDAARPFTRSTMRCVHDCSSLRLVHLVFQWTASLSCTAVMDTSCSLLRNGERHHSCRGLTRGTVYSTLHQISQFHCFGIVLGVALVLIWKV